MNFPVFHIHFNLLYFLLNIISLSDGQKLTKRILNAFSESSDVIRQSMKELISELDLIKEAVGFAWVLRKPGGTWVTEMGGSVETVMYISCVGTRWEKGLQLWLEGRTHFNLHEGLL